jgi:hypothetical protein
MFKRSIASALALSVLIASATAHADETPHRSRAKQTTGIVLTSVGGTLLLTAPIVFLAGMAYASANPYSYAAFGPIALGAIGGGTIGLGMMIPGIVMTATCRQPTWTDTRVQPPGPRALTIPLVNARF